MGTLGPFFPFQERLLFSEYLQNSVYMQKVRVDKWLWAVRIFKSRSQATKACKSGKVKIEGENVKPSQSIERGDTLHVRKEKMNRIFKVVDLLEKRVSATLAEPCYEELTPEEELNKFKDWYKTSPQFGIRERGAGRPTKKERRAIERFKGKK